MQTYAQRMKKPQLANLQQSTAATAHISNQAMLGILNEPDGDTRFSEALRAKFEAKPKPHSECATPSKLSPEIIQKAEERYQVPLDGLKVFQDTGLQDSGFNGYAQGNEVHLDSKLSPTEHERVALHEIGHVVQRGSGTAYGSGFVDDSTLEHQADTGFVAGEVFSMPTNATGPVMGDPTNFPRLKQEGPTCGIYALAMALMSLCPPKGGLKKGGDYRAKGDEIANAIKQKAIENNLSSIGEFYDADMLCAAANDYSDQSDYKVTAKVQDFESSNGLNEILLEAKSNGQRVLIAFAATDEGIPASQSTPAVDTHAFPMTGADLSADKMADAHWCVLNTFDSHKSDDNHKCCKLSDNPSGSYVGIREGWNSNKIYREIQRAEHSRVSVQTLFDSNQRLADTMDWNAFVSQDTKARTAVQKRKLLKPDKFEHTVLTEKANLKGKLILISRFQNSEAGQSQSKKRGKTKTETKSRKIKRGGK